ncbi:hypothetical protein [Pseudoxanthomonas sp. SE1]|uniref:hypothetical protein n=1 Tax=Pseudoxanthomonas sp. SE1 TaxID=1664560 RepID=UPI00240DB6E8|nr:hypothetical protein [Pseudoxanthomonas sp. SE1]WFC43169.1 hypothetical protein OY559_06580 [Pseudoxanthomonas sp. SE1]
MISYEDFLTNAEPEDIRVMNLLSQGQTISFEDSSEAEAMFQRIARLDGAGFVLRASRHYERVDGVLWQRFEGLIDPVAANYLARAASERVQLSREPLPEA